MHQVNIYGSRGTSRLNGNRENTDVGQFLADYLDVDLDKVTKILREKGVGTTAEGTPAWMGKSLKVLLDELEESDSTFDPDHFQPDCIDQYHGDFKRHKH